MKKLLIITVLITIHFFSAFSQTDTIYLNSKFQPMQKGKHSYYRTITKMTSGKYKILDYYNNGRIQMAGYSDKPDAKHFVGIVVRYGRKERIINLCEHKTYNKGWITFYSKNKKKVASLWCINDKKNGIAYFYNRKGEVIAKGEYKDDKIYSGKRPGIMALMMFNEYNIDEYEKGSLVKKYQYYYNGELAMKANIVPGKFKISDAIFYDNTGKKIGDCVYENDKPIEGHCVEFYEKGFFSDKPAKIKYINIYEKGSIKNRESFNYNGKQIGNCTYKYNSPYDGKALKDYVLYTFNKGKNEGDVIVYNNNCEKIVHKYSLKDGEKTGKTTFYDYKNNEYVGEYKDNKPYNGYVYNRKLCKYKNGLKNGVCYSFNNDKLLSETTYVNDKKEGKQI